MLLPMVPKINFRPYLKFNIFYTNCNLRKVNSFYSHNQISSIFSNKIIPHP